LLCHASGSEQPGSRWALLPGAALHTLQALPATHSRATTPVGTTTLVLRVDTCWVACTVSHQRRPPACNDCTHTPPLSLACKQQPRMLCCGMLLYAWQCSWPLYHCWTCAASAATHRTQHIMKPDPHTPCVCAAPDTALDTPCSSPGTVLVGPTACTRQVRCKHTHDTGCPAASCSCGLMAGAVSVPAPTGCSSGPRCHSLSPSVTRLTASLPPQGHAWIPATPARHMGQRV
jgi:hypothetical protein